MFEISILLLASLVNAILGLLVYVKNPRSATNRLFVLLTLGFIAWSLISYVSVHPMVFSQLVLIRFVLFFASFLCLTVYLTFTTFPSHTLQGSPTLRRLAISYTGLVMLLTQTPLIFRSLTDISGKVAPQPGPGIVLFMVLVVGLLGGGLWNLIAKYRRASSNLKMQLRFVLAGLAGTFGLIFLTNLVFVVALNNSSLVPLGPAYTLIFSGAMAYAIVRHHLFDIRAAAARSVAYLFLIGTMTLIYSLIVFGGINVLFAGPENETLRQIISVILVTPLALSFQRIKNFFDRVSNQIFYRDSYDIQDLLDGLGNIAVSEIDLYRILNDTRELLSGALKSSFVEFVLFRNGRPYFEAHTHKTLSQRLLVLGPLVHEQHKDLMVIEELGIRHPLYSPFHDAGVALSLKLKAHEQVVGYIIFGEKKSGDTYTPQDRRLLLIAANELAIAMQNALRFEEIENFNLTLQARIDEATRKLRHVNEKLKQMDETKDDFISMASHQLRTPLTSIKGYLSMVMEGDAGKITPQQKEMLGQAFFSSQRMVYLIADLLNVSRLKTGKFIIEPTPVNLAEMVEQEMQQLKETAAAKDLTFTYDKPADFPTLMLDETKTRQVIMNFADNAIYYTPAGGHIRVEVRDLPTSIELRVIDDGIGVPKSEQPHLFTKFYRAKNAQKARPDGTGLGLFMAKKVVVAQGGAVIFETEEGKGSTFGFTIPKDTAHLPGKSATSPKTLVRA